MLAFIAGKLELRRCPPAIILEIAEITPWVLCSFGLLIRKNAVTGVHWTESWDGRADVSREIALIGLIFSRVMKSERGSHWRSTKF